MRLNLPALETSRLRLRPATAADAATIAELCCATDVRLFPWDDECPNEAQVAQLLRDLAHAGAPHGFWLLVPADSATPIGVTGLVPPGVAAEADVRLLGTSEPLVALLAPHRGTGHATEALAAVLQYAFEECGWTRVAAAVAVRDADGLRLADRLGFTAVSEAQGPADRLRTFRLERQAFALADVQAG